MKNLKRFKKLHQLFGKLHQLFQKLYHLFLKDQGVLTRAKRLLKKNLFFFENTFFRVFLLIE